MIIPGNTIERLLQLLKKFLTDDLKLKLTIETKAFAVIKEMRTHKGTRTGDTAKASFEKAAGRTFAAGANDLYQFGTMPIWPQRIKRLAQQLQTHKFGDAPLGVIDLVNRTVIGKVGEGVRMWVHQ